MKQAGWHSAGRPTVMAAVCRQWLKQPYLPTCVAGAARDAVHVIINRVNRMKNFEYQNPTKIVFGRGAEEKVGAEAAA